MQLLDLGAKSQTELEGLVLDSQSGDTLKGQALHVIFEKFVATDREKYCLNAFKFTYGWAQKLIRHAQIIAILAQGYGENDLAVYPVSESISRPLGQLPDDRIFDTWEYIRNHAPYSYMVSSGGTARKITQDYVREVVQHALTAPSAKITYKTRDDLPMNAIYPSDNAFDIPLLSLGMQAESVDLPFTLWDPRQSYKVASFHFYTSDNKLSRIEANPSRVVNSRAINVCELNFSLYGQTPRAQALERIYKKRWLSRLFQEQGLRIFVDLNVNPVYLEDNFIGVPFGWRAYSTRGYNTRLEDTEEEYKAAVRHAEKDDILFVVVGGGRGVKELCQSRGWVWVAEASDQVRGRE